MFNKLLNTRFTFIISIIIISMASVHAEEDLINQTASVNLSYVRTEYELSAPNVAQTIEADTLKLKAAYSRLLNLKYVMFSTLHLYQVTIADSVTKSEKNELMGGLEGGVRYLINPRFSATLSGELQRLVYFKSTRTLVSGGGHWSPTVSAAGFYQAISREHFSIIPSIKASVILGTGESKMGTAYLVNATYNHYLPELRLSASLGYESRTQKYNDLKLTESGPQFTFGVGKSF